jgi:HemY protein
MIRVVLFLAVVAVVALGAAWLADRPGEVVITWPWLGQVIETQLSVLVLAVALVAIAAILLWSAVRTLWRSPGSVAFFLRHRRSARGYQAISRGLIAIGAGDLRAARRFAGEARRYAGDEPLALLLGAQTAQLAGNRAAAEIAFRKMADHGDTRLLGLHGLFVEAQRRNDMAAARAVAEEAVRANPAAAWAAQAVLDFRCAQGDWPGALAALDSNMKSGLIDKASFRRSRAVLLTARALSGAEREAARADVVEAVKLSPGLVPAAALAGRFLSEAGEVRKAVRLLEAAWRAHPHPDLAEAYAHVRTGDSARDRLARMQTLAKLSPNDPEGLLAVVRAAIDAREFAVARATLAPLALAPTQRVALMMAEIEEEDTGDVGRARAWMARALHAARDPAWTADGLVSDKWLPVSPATGRLDAFQWKVPLADLTPPGRVIDQGEIEAESETEAETVPVTAPVAARSPPPSDPAADDDAPEFDGPPSRPAHDDTTLPAVVPRRAGSGETHVVDTVIPLVHSPDDPGPDAELAADPAPEAPAADGWWRGLFR